MQAYKKIPHHNYVLYPDYLNLSVLPETVKEKLREHYSDKLPEYQRKDLLAKLQVTHQPELLIKAREFIMSIDQVRGLSYADFTPELKMFI
jgi:hypothetical protein